ncbi:hypothetical protein QWY77_09120 [Thalassotalea ponticola]|uniref:hypothetical protein n=1 Tax=Thalassotalea ponticola TaxID=1523392 RepID=UPI0025B2F22F|nr:hypothetical protein [Thalassotalea ponticola]MDN3652918.1 hypothetical protein [Thalassotalea ponticola]
MKTIKIAAVSLLCLASMQNTAIATPYSSSSDTTATISIDIPMLADAKVFAAYTDSMPAVVNYFTQADTEQIRQYYTEKFGVPVSERTQYGRLELYFDYMQSDVRVIVDPQDYLPESNMQEVDVIMTAKP